MEPSIEPPPPKYKDRDHFAIILTVGKEIDSIDDITNIYRGFVLPSWISPHCDVSILERKPSYSNLLREVQPWSMREDGYSCYVTKIKGKIYHFDEVRKEEVVDRKGDEVFIQRARITYQASADKGSYEIVVKLDRNSNTTISIVIEDPNKFFRVLSPASVGQRTQTKWLQKPNELYHPYIEPENVRTIETPNTADIHLAFRGGGAKGAAYVGAVKALLEDNPGIPIKSIIGSSAGGILALAMAAGCSTQNLIEHCKSMVKIPGDTTIQHKGEVDDVPEMKQRIKTIKEDIWKALVEFGLVPNNNRPQVEELLGNEEFLVDLLEWLSTKMDGVRDMFKIIIKGENKLLNYYGLLLGVLLKGQEVKKIALKIIAEYLDSPKKGNKTNLQRLKEFYPKFYSKLEEQQRQHNVPDPIRTYAAALTMEQFYQLTKLEFTVTCTDLKSKILRFFNHKTTPNLPVHMAVIMTGSFPIAFKAQEWQPSWGKYYIHYERWRREIDLTGHRFTDGGMLANFPMMYLDNEDMRPMYFSHKCKRNPKDSQQDTKVIGFGLKVIEKGLQEKKKQQENSEKLLKKVKSHIGYWWITKFANGYGSAPDPRTTNTYDLMRLFQKIPIIEFLYSLLETYIAAGDNLVLECFESRICFESPYKPIGRYKPLEKEQQDQSPSDVGGVIEMMKRHQSKLSGVCNSREFRQAKVFARQTLLSILNILREQLYGRKNYNGLMRKRFDQMKEANFSLIGELEKIECEDRFTRCVQPQDLTKKLEDIYKQLKDLKTQVTLGDLDRLTQNQPHVQLSEKGLFDARELRIRKYVMNQLKDSRSEKLHLVFQSTSQNNRFSYETFKLVEDCIFKASPSNGKYMEEIAEDVVAATEYLNQPDKESFRQQVKNDLVQSLIRGIGDATEIRIERLNYTLPIAAHTEMIKERTKIAEQLRKDAKEYEIASITCGSSNSVLGFLIAAGYDSKTIETELNQIEEYFKLDDKVLEQSQIKFEKNEWALPDKCKINRDFEESVTKHYFNFFKELKTKVGDVYGRTVSDEEKKRLIIQNINALKDRFDQSKELVQRGYDRIVEHMMTSSEDCPLEGFAEQFSKEMGLKGKEDYYEVNKKIADDTKTFTKMILESFGEQIRFILYLFANQAESDFIRSRPQEQQKHMWKVMFVTRFLTAQKLKERVQAILLKLSLPVDIGLRDFYRMAPRKIQLTFPAVDISNKKVRFINQRTYPQMPVWAAVSIGASLPMLYPMRRVESDWCKDITEDSQKRDLENIFGDGKYLRSMNFISGNLISCFPLDLITNRTVQERFYQSTRYTMLFFGVQQDSARKRKNVLPFVVSYPSRWDILKMYVNFGQTKINFEGSVRGNILMTYMESHDNLVLDLYRENLLELPVRLDTLSFSTFKPIGEHENEYPKLADLLNETYFTTKEKFAPFWIGKAMTYVRAQIEKKRIYGLEQPFIALEFISKDRSCKDLMRKYKIEYKLNFNSTIWEQVENQKILVRPAQQYLWLRFLYPSKRNEGEFKPEQILMFQASELCLSITLPNPLPTTTRIFPIDYKGVSEKNTMNLTNSYSASLNFLPQAADIEIRVQSIVSPQTTGLYCLECSRRLGNIRPAGATKLQVCNSKPKGQEHSAGMFFRCQAVDDHPENQDRSPKKPLQYCLKCFKNFAIVKKGNSIYCQYRHLYIYHDLTSSPLDNERCDVCHKFVETCYKDGPCNRSICTKCCMEFTISHQIKR